MERALRWYGDARRFAWSASRYFNAAGADHDRELGEEHSPETHLIPLTLEADSVRQVIEAVEKATGRRLPFRVAPRRAGDPAVLVADSSLARKVLDWHP